jgi:hypothetical protein
VDAATARGRDAALGPRFLRSPQPLISGRRPRPPPRRGLTKTASCSAWPSASDGAASWP